ncbi:MAG: TIGR04211 family SH3 domain-containing protein [Gammaproteobacteria bacterium]
MTGAGQAGAVMLALLAARADAGTAYVSDELVLGVYAEQNGQGQRLATLHSGASLETLAVNGEFTQVRLSEGTTGWVKSSYLTTQEPATARLKQLQDELDRNRATTPALAEAAARSELEQLKRELKAKQSELDALRGVISVPAPAADSARANAAGGPPAAELSPPRATPRAPAAAGAMTGVAALTAYAWVWVLVLLAVLACGFWVGYATLARRVRHKFGGIKVY